MVTGIYPGSLVKQNRGCVCVCVCVCVCAYIIHTHIYIGMEGDREVVEERRERQTERGLF